MTARCIAGKEFVARAHIDGYVVHCGSAAPPWTMCPGQPGVDPCAAA